jgi:hypothetical protein
LPPCVGMLYRPSYPPAYRLAHDGADDLLEAEIALQLDAQPRTDSRCTDMQTSSFSIEEAAQ